MLLLLAALTAQAAASSACIYDHAGMLALDEQAFDQNMTGGWRPLADRGCEAAAADLIRDWREAHRDISDPGLSYWHEGQLRAIAGQTDRAAALFRRARRTPAEDRGGWNAYVDASIAFLRRDRLAFDRARARLVATPEPMNLPVLDAFRRCWGQSYDRAYGPECRVKRPAAAKPRRRS